MVQEAVIVPIHKRLEAGMMLASLSQRRDPLIAGDGAAASWRGIGPLYDDLPPLAPYKGVVRATWRW